MTKIRGGRTERGRYWRRWLEKWRRSSLTQAEFCRRHGLKAGNFAWWKRKLGEATRAVTCRTGANGRGRESCPASGGR